MIKGKGNKKMKVQILQEDLAKALNITSRFTSTKVQLPVLANILIKTEKNKLILWQNDYKALILIIFFAPLKNAHKKQA